MRGKRGLCSFMIRLMVLYSPTICSTMTACHLGGARCREVVPHFTTWVRPKRTRILFQRRDFTPQEQVDNAPFISGGLFCETKAQCARKGLLISLTGKRTERESAGWICMAADSLSLSVQSFFFYDNMEKQGLNPLRKLLDETCFLSFALIKPPTETSCRAWLPEQCFCR